MKILVSGATGFIGQRLTRELYSQGHELYLLVRPLSKSKARESFSDLPKISFIEGDIIQTDVLTNIYTVSRIIDEIECVVHMAALYDLQASLTDAYIMNVVGTQNILNLMRKMKNLKYFHYFSTYAVNPALTGVVNEEDLTQDSLGFPDEYTKTKNNAEHIVKNSPLPNINIVIHRPGIIIGDSKDGKMDKMDGPYYFFDFIQKLKKIPFITKNLPTIPLPILKDSNMPVLPVDMLVKWSATIINRPPEEKYKCYHLVPAQNISTKDFLEHSMELLGIPIRIMAIKQSHFFLPLFPLLRLPTQIIFYMNQEARFDRKNLERDYPELTSPTYREYLPRIIEGHLKAKA